MSLVKEGDWVSLVMEGKADEVYGNGNFIIGNNLIEVSAEHVKSVTVMARPPKVGDVVQGSEIEKLTSVGTVIEGVASKYLWLLSTTPTGKVWMGSEGGSTPVGSAHFYRANMYRIIHLP